MALGRTMPIVALYKPSLRKHILWAQFWMYTQDTMKSRTFIKSNESTTRLQITSPTKLWTTNRTKDWLLPHWEHTHGLVGWLGLEDTCLFGEGVHPLASFLVTGFFFNFMLSDPLSLIFIGSTRTILLAGLVLKTHGSLVKGFTPLRAFW